jgi:hypothetical protein
MHRWLTRGLYMRRTISAIAAALGVFAVAIGQAQTLQARVAPELYQPPKTDAECKLTPVDPSHLFIAVGVMEGDTLTSVQLDDPNGRSTVVRVRVNEGTRPMTVILQAQTPVIWDFEGLVWRVERAIVLSAGDMRMGVRGLPAGRAEFPDLARCPRAFFPLWNASEAQRNESLEAYFGRQPDRAGFESKPNSLTLPQVEFATTPKGAPRHPFAIVRKADDMPSAPNGPPKTFSEVQAQSLNGDRKSEADRDLVLYHPGGFRVIDANGVVSPGPVLTPETFPGEAGLIQLENAGAIRPARRAEINAFVEGISKPYRSKLSPDYRVHTSFDYVVTRDVMLPPGLHGGHLKNFLVLHDVPTPRGNAGHGCLAFVDGFRLDCPGGKSDLIEKLHKLPPPERLEACRALPVPPGATLEAVATNEPAGHSAVGAGELFPSPIDVRVLKPGPVVLVLNTYHPAVWRVSSGPETQIVGVLLGGYHTSRVEGVDPDTPVVKTDWRGGVNRRSPPPECEPVYEYLGRPFMGGPAAMLLDRQVQAWTGRNLDGLRGAHRLKDVEIR